MNASQYVEQILRGRSDGQPVVCAGVGSGVTTKGAVEGGADLLAVYNTAVYRIMGLPTALAFLPYDDANRLTCEALPQVIAAAGATPVLAGLGAHDPRVNLETLIATVTGMGAAGVTNEPFIGIYSPDLRAHLEAAGLGFERELELIRRAVKQDLLTLGWVFDAAQAASMTDAGARILGINLGLTMLGANDPGQLDQAIRTLEKILQAARKVDPKVITLIHGGLFNDPASVGAALQATGADGYVTGSTAESSPVRAGVAAAVRGFKRAIRR
ncbi:MAG TPA: phosphoenolpyruvate hydrolase family protein [Chthoniobacterales bacterium]